MISLHDVLETTNGQLFAGPHSQLFDGLSFDSARTHEAELFVIPPNAVNPQAAMREAVRNGAAGLLTMTPPEFSTRDLTVILTGDLHQALLGWTRFVLARTSLRLVVVAGSGNNRVTSEATARVLAQTSPVCVRPANQSPYPLLSALVTLAAGSSTLVVEWDAVLAAELNALRGELSPDVLVLTGSPADSAIADFAASLSPDALLVRDYSANLSPATAPSVTAGIDAFGADWIAYNVVSTLDGTGFDLRYGHQRLLGRWTHLLSQAQLLALVRALAVGAYLGVSPEDALPELKELMPLPGHMRALAGHNGATMIDCTAAATLSDAVSALDWLAAVRADGRRTAVVLGELDGGPYPVAAYREIGRRAVTASDMLLTEGADSAAAGPAAIDAGQPAQYVVNAHSPADVVSRLESDYAPDADDVVLVLGGASARMERVVAALLASPDDVALLARHVDSGGVFALGNQTRPSCVEVDLDALAHNVRQLKQMVGPDVMLTAVVKANAYGNGAVSVARTALLNGAGHLAVASLEEALELREAGIDAPILVMSYTAPDAIRQAVRREITVTAYDADLARAYDQMAAAAGDRLRVHLKVDTGMGRLGVLPGQAVTFYRQLLGMRHLHVEGIFTHFAAADEDPDYTAEQARRFAAVLAQLEAVNAVPRYVHACNSAGTLAFPEYHYNMVRVGLAMHGLSPSERVRVPEDFRPVMRWKTFVAQVKTLPAGHSIGYGCTYVCEEEERIAVLPIGYADGFRRGPANAGAVLIRGQLAPLVGRVSMEKTVAIVSHIPNVSIGDEVVLIGEQGDQRITADDVAARWGTISYEVLCSALARVPRR